MKTALFGGGGQSSATWEVGSYRSPRVLVAASLQPHQLARLRALLEVDGATLICVQTSPQALLEASRHPYALAVVDENIPGCGGLQVCRQLVGSLDAHVPVILRVDEHDEKKRADGLNIGALHILPLKSDVDEIYLHMRNHLRMWRAPGSAAPLAEQRRTVGVEQSVVDHLPYALVVTDARHRVTHSNAAANGLAALDHETVMCLSLSEIFAAMRLDIATSWVLQKVASDGFWEGEVHARPNGGAVQAFWLHAQMVNETGKSVEACYHTFVLHDITHLILREHQLRWLAETDALTGLANRNLLITRLNEAVKFSWQAGLSPSLLFIDLDGFKQVNDQLGHGAGDRILCDVARILEASVRANDMAARIGGDEFVVLLIGATRETLVETAQRIIDRLLFELTGTQSQRIHVTCSIGIAIAPQDGNDAASLLKLADKAMYATKRGGKNGYRFASEATVTI
jgi:diguanylate cyclase (GGDEF)-like protein